MLARADVNKPTPTEKATKATASTTAATTASEFTSPLLQKRVDAGASFPNVALSFAADILRSEAARVDGQLVDDYTALLRGNAVYINNFVCAEKDLGLYDALKAELVAATGAQTNAQGSGLIEWSRHQVFENPTDLSPTFNDIVDMLAEYFDTEVYASRLNYYRDGTQWKPQHHDSHAYGGRKAREDFTVGITLGASRSLLFVHTASGREFSFPQKNGDCFAFTGEVNQTFTHGVPRLHTPIGDRFSIIAWGRRRTLNSRNGGGLSSGMADVRTADGRDIETLEDAIAAAKHMVSASAVPANKKVEGGAGSTKAPAPKKKNRLQ